MTGFEVEIKGLRQSAASAIEAGAEAGKIDLGTAVGTVAGALPGSESAGAIPRLADAWDQRVHGWSSDIHEFGSTVSKAADMYESNERAAEKDFHDSILDWLTSW
ncbi:hypothetical protein [Nocardia sp. NPDC049149]|uniref:hypothetical protein n=1 Tax=Nocardia sp. NPDC049149 TaxID=3364315 RepID=UPI00371D437F